MCGPAGLPAQQTATRPRRMASPLSAPGWHRGARRRRRRCPRLSGPDEPLAVVASDGAKACRGGAELRCGSRRWPCARLPGPARLLPAARSRPRRHRLRAVAASIGWGSSPGRSTVAAPTWADFLVPRLEVASHRRPAPGGASAQRRELPRAGYMLQRSQPLVAHCAAKRPPRDAELGSFGGECGQPGRNGGVDLDERAHTYTPPRAVAGQPGAHHLGGQFSTRQ